MAGHKVSNIDEYIEQFPEEVQKVLQKVRRTIKKEAPNATEAMGYGVPTFKLNGNLVNFAAFKNHIGIYPGPDAIKAFKKELAGYKTSTGTIQFPLAKPIPYDLIRDIIRYRVKEVA